MGRIIKNVFKGIGIILGLGIILLTFGVCFFFFGGSVAEFFTEHIILLIVLVSLVIASIAAIIIVRIKRASGEEDEDDESDEDEEDGEDEQDDEDDDEDDEKKGSRRRKWRKAKRREATKQNTVSIEEYRRELARRRHQEKIN